MSILDSVLSGISEGIAASADDISALRKILEPEMYPTRKALSSDLVKAIGYDPEDYWNRRELSDDFDERYPVASDDEYSSPEREEKREKFIDDSLDMLSQFKANLRLFVSGRASTVAITLTAPGESPEPAITMLGAGAISSDSSDIDSDDDEDLLGDEPEPNPDSMSEEIAALDDDDDEDLDDTIIVGDDELN